MRYGRYMFWMRPTAQCAECGAYVRLRRFPALFAIGAAAFVLSIRALATVPSALEGLGVVAAVGVVLFAIDYGSYHVLRWEGDDELTAGEDELLELGDGNPFR